MTTVDQPKTETRGMALIDQLMTCDPYGWDRSRLVANLEEGGEEQAEFLEGMLEACRAANLVATPAPPLAWREACDAAEELRNLIRNLEVDGVDERGLTLARKMGYGSPDLRAELKSVSQAMITYGSASTEANHRALLGAFEVYLAKCDDL